MTLKGHSNNIMFLSVSISHIVTIIHRQELCMLFHNFGFIKCILAVCQLITILLEKCKYNLGLGGHMTYALGSSGTMSMAMFCLFVCLSVCLSVSPFPQPCLNTETVTLVSYPGMVNHRSLLNLDLIRPW